MGKSLITSDAGAGLYSVTSDYGESIAAARIVKLEARKAAIELEISAGETTASELNVALGAAHLTLNAEIDLYAASEKETADQDAIDLATTNVLRADENIKSASSQQGIRGLDLANIISEIAELTAGVFTENHQLWCADYTTQASGTVATIEINGEPPVRLIAPSALAATDADGLLTAREVMSAAQVFLNAALLPGWQKYSPNYRQGSITSINRDNDTCTVSLDTAKSSAQSLNINQSTTLSSVPIEYMSCNSFAFDVYDDVVVSFAGDWSNPKVIGFIDNPKLCYPDKIFCLIEPYDAEYLYVTPAMIGNSTGGTTTPFYKGYTSGNDSWETGTEENHTLLNQSTYKQTLRIRLDVMWTQQSKTGKPFQLANPLYLSSSHGLTVHLAPTYSGNTIYLQHSGGDDSYSKFVCNINTSNSTEWEGYDMAWAAFGYDGVSVDKAHANAWMRSHFEPPPDEITFDIDGTDIIYEIEQIGVLPDDIEGDRFVYEIPGEPVGEPIPGDPVTILPYLAGVGDNGVVGTIDPEIVGVTYKLKAGQ